MKWPWEKTYDADAAREKFLVSIQGGAHQSTPLVTQIMQSSTPAKAVGVPMSFISVLKAIGKGFLKGLSWAVTYAIPVEKLVALLFPAASPEVTELADATGLLQTAILQVEQKYAASGVQDGTGAQKSAEVLLLAGQAVTTLLKQAGVNADTSYIQSLINAIVAILNVPAPASMTSTIPAATTA